MKRTTAQIYRKKALPCIAAAMMLQVSVSLYAERSIQTLQIDIGSQQAGTALMELANASGTQIMVPQDVGEAITVQAVQGEYTLGAALDAMLKGTGLTYEFTADNVVLVKNAISQSKMEDKTRIKSIEEMVVTAQKREQSVSDVPISITVLRGEDLEKLKIGDLEDLAFSVPGLSVLSNGDNQRRIYLRGVANLAGSSSLVGVYLDEIPVTGGAAGQLDLRTYDLERVEVLKGPQGTLYGVGSSGGTLRFITKDPQLEDFSGRANVGLSFTHDGSTSHKFDGAIDIPVIENELGFRISGVVEDEGGWIDHSVTEDINTRSVKDVRIKGLWVPSETMEVKLTAVIHRNDGSPNQGEDDKGFYAAPLGEMKLPFIEDNYDIYNLTLGYDFGSATFQSISSYFDSEKYSRNLGSITDGSHTLFGSNVEFESVSQEMRLSSSGDGPLHWTVGAFYREFDELVFFPEFRFGVPGTDSTISEFKNTSASESWAVFGDASYEVTDRFEFGVGLRYFEDDRTATSFPFLFNGFPVGLVEVQNGAFDSVSPRIYANYDVTEDSMLYVSIAEGFRSGGFNTLGQPAYEPEELLTYELGAKLALLDGRLTTDFAFYYSDYDGYIVRGDPTGTGVGIDSNAGNVSIKGVEWTLLVYATDNLSFGFNGNYADAVIEELNAADTAFVVGDRVNLIPEYLFNLSANYEFSSAGRPGFARLDYNHQGRSVYINRPLGIFGMSDVINMLNFNVGLQWSENLYVGVFGRNMLDDRGYIDALIGQSARTRPRTLGIEFSVDF